MTDADIAGLIQRANQELEGMRFPECLAAVAALEQMTRENKKLCSEAEKDVEIIASHVRVIARLCAALRAAGIQTEGGEK